MSTESGEAQTFKKAPKACRTTYLHWAKPSQASSKGALAYPAIPSAAVKAFLAPLCLCPS